MTIKKTHTGIVITKDGPQRKKLHQTETMWVVGKTECYRKDTGKRHFAEHIRLDGRHCENSVIATKSAVIRKEIDQAKPFKKLANTDVIPQAAASYRPVDKTIVVESDWISHGTPGVFRLLLKPLADLVIVIRSFAFPRVPMFHAFLFFMIICAWVKYEHN